MYLSKFAIVCALTVCLGSPLFGQQPPGPTIVSLTIPEGFPLGIVLTEKVHFKSNELVRGKITDPVYAFDREVIPAGTEVQGRVTGFQSAGKLKRIFAMITGDFTPQRQVEITFETLDFSDGTRIPIQTSVIGGAEKLIVSGETDKRALTPTVKDPGADRLKTFLWNLSPYHPQSVRVGTHFKATLLTALDFGNAVLGPEKLERIGSQPPAGSTISARLVTNVSSDIEVGAPVEALLTEPLFTADHHLIYPVGSKVVGQIENATEAHKGHHNGKLTVKFTSIMAPEGFAQEATAREIDGSLSAVQVVRNMDDIRITADGQMRVSESKKRFIGPAYAMVKAGRSINADSKSFDHALANAFGGKVTKQFAHTNSGFGLTGSVLGAMVPPVGIGLGIFGAARSIYSNFIGRGQDIRLPADTQVQIDLR
jgi:hypothetical protein